ncbi:MAG: ABC transporter ATP-binding protein [Nitrospinae bacterium]|nr:ABC transporter ATP-binding protein [Nitrospinota bacterium]
MGFFEVKGLVKYFGGLAAVNGVSFSVAQGEIFGLIGPNGSGKTTIFNLVSGFFRPTAGEVHFKGKRIDGLKPHKINRLGIARTFQVVRPLKRMTVEDNVLAAAFAKAGSMRTARGLAAETMEFCGIHGKREMIAGGLTIGDRKRLEITRALATKPAMILLDETFAGLNPSEQDEAIALIRKIKQSGVTIVIVEHIMKVMMSISDRIHVINFGQTIAEGSPLEVTAAPAVIEAYLGEPQDA